MKRAILSKVVILVSGLGLFGAPVAPVAAQSFGDRLTVHGFLSQAYGHASEYPIFGLSKNGTADYRALALQGRFAITSSDFVVVQVGHRALGNSALGQLEKKVELDWAFYQKRIWGTSIRAGRVPMPRGIFNEIRDVGTVLPFYRASKAFYSEGLETVDGVSVSRSFVLPGGFGLDGYAYGGSFELRAEVITESGMEAVQEPLKDVYGSQAWLTTPVSGVRVGGGLIDSKMKNGSASTKDFKMWWVSAEAVRDRFFVRGEYLDATRANSIDYVGYYGQGGVRVWRGLWANVQAEWNTNTILNLPLPVDLKIDAIRDQAYGLSYAISPKLVLKGEYHRFKGYQLDVPVDYFGAPARDTYFLLSVAASF